MPAAIRPESLLKDLAQLWQSMAQPEHGASTASGVLRACAMTLITAAEDEADGQRASEVIAELMHEHPSRAIVLRPNESGALDARVFAQCWMPFGSRQQICCEQIEIMAAREHLGDVPNLMLGLLAPDLPVVLWCRGTRWLAEPHFERLLALTGKVIVDSARFPSPAEAFSRIAALARPDRRAADLAWGRITPWREAVSQQFEAGASAIRKVRIVFSGASAQTQALYLAAWLRLGMPGAAATMETAAEGPEGIVGVYFDDAELRAPAHRNASDCDAMREELSITGPDRIFEKVLQNVHTLL